MFNGKFISCEDHHKIDMINNPYAHDPTYEELISALEYDQTDKIPYEKGVFSCGNFAEMVHNNLERMGIRSGIVRLDYTDKTTNHVDNVFMTTDKGLVFTCSIREDRIGHFEIGKKREYTLMNGQSFKSDGIINSISIYW